MNNINSHLFVKFDCCCLGSKSHVTSKSGDIEELTDLEVEVLLRYSFQFNEVVAHFFSR